VLYIIGVIIIILIAIWLIKKLGRFFSKLFKVLFTFISKTIYFIILGPAILCTKIFYGITKLLHLQSFIYYLLSFCSLPSFIYLCGIHISYSRKEKFINVKEFSLNKKRQRNDTIAMSFFLTLEGIGFLFIPAVIKVIEEESDAFTGLGLIYIIFAFIYTFYKIVKWSRENRTNYEHYIEWRKWTQKDVDFISEDDIENILISISTNLLEQDKNKNKFTVDGMPFGRAIAFISYFNKNLEDEDPIYFSPIMSSDENELREYGILITTNGIYISVQGKQDVEIPFMGLWTIKKNDTKTFFDYGLSFGEPKVIEVENNFCSLNFDFFINIFEQIENISLAMLHDKVKTNLDEALESYKDAEIENAGERFNIKQHGNDIANAVELGGLGTGLSQNAHIYNNEIKGFMNGARGGGYAAEYGNNAIDRLTGKGATNAAQELVNGHQAKSGADRIVGGVQIQTKYYKSASESIGAAFEHKQALYLNTDGTMMQIEVPRDQYNQALQEMQKRIKSGQVPGETNPDNAKKYVRKGHFTYFQANNIALAGSIEGIAVDAAQGIVCAFPGAGITVVLSFASAVWHGQDIKEAAKQSTLSGLKVMGRSAVIYTITMQLSRKEIINIFTPKRVIGNPQVIKSLGGIENPVFSGAEKLAGKINSSALAKSKAGQALGLDQVKSRQIIGGTVTAAVVFGPDVCKAFQGKISGKQLIKNSIVNTAGLVGAAIGTPLPIVGSMVGGAAASFFTKKVLDIFIEDDAVEMFRIMREEFLDIVMLYAFNKDEFDIIVNGTIANPEMSKILQNMHQSGSPKDYADALINGVVQKALSEREKITNAKIEEGMRLLLEDKSIA